MPQKFNLDDLPDSETPTRTGNRGVNLDDLPDQDNSQSQPGFLSRAWHAVSDPLTDAPSRLGHAISDYMTDPSKAIISPTGQGGLHDVAAKALAYGQGFMGGTAEGVGDLASGFTSPLNIATILATGGASTLAESAPAASRLLNIGGRILSAPVAAHGAYEAARPDATMKERAFGAMEAAGGMAGMMHTPSARTASTEDFLNSRIPEKPTPTAFADEVAQSAPVQPKPPVSELDSYIDSMFGDKGGSGIELVNDDAPAMNASGESAASAEAMSRNAGMKSRGEQFVVYDRAGNERPLIGPDAVDYHPAKGETYGVKTPDGFRTLTDNGGKVNFKPVESANESAHINIDELPDQEPNQSPKMTDVDYMKRKTPVNLDYPLEGYGNTDAAMEATGMGRDTLNAASLGQRPANDLFGQIRSDIRRNSADALRNPIDYSDIENTSPDVIMNGEAGKAPVESAPKNIDLEDLPHHEAPTEPTTKQKFRIDRQSGAFIPIDEAGNQIGPAVSEKGEPVRPDLAYQSKYSKGSVKGGPEITPDQEFNTPPSDVRQSELFGSTGASGPGGPFDPPIGGGDIPGGPDPNVNQPNMFGEPPQDKGSPLQQAYDLSRSLMSVDPPFVTSAAFRQASPLIGTKPWRSAWIKAAKSYGSEATYDAIMNNIKEQPLFKAVGGNPSYAEQSGLRLGDLTSYTKREEFIKSELAEKIPLYGKAVRASNRAYTAFLNSARADTFSNLIQDLEKQGLNPKTDLALGKEVADYVNTATGTGKLSIGSGGYELNLEKNAKLLSNVFFSPRKMASEIQMLNPANYVMGNPYIRKQYLASMVRRVGTWWTMAGLASLGGATVNTHPTNPDFGKIKIGNTRIDPPGGLQQYLVLGAQLAGGGKTSSVSNKFNQFGKGYKPETRGSTMMNFGVNRLHPTAKAAWDIATAHKGNEFHTGDRMIQAVVPMFMDDLMSVAQENPELAPLILGAAGTGMGTQTYDKGSFGKPTYLPQKYDLNFGR